MSVPLLLFSSLETCFLKYVAYQNAHLFHASVSWWDLHAEAYVRIFCGDKNIRCDWSSMQILEYESGCYLVHVNISQSHFSV